VACLHVPRILGLSFFLFSFFCLVTSNAFLVRN
jgi:hypothetical protein